MTRTIRRNIMKKKAGSNRIRRMWANYQYNKLMSRAKGHKLRVWYEMMFKKLFKEVGHKKRQVLYARIYAGKEII